MWSRPILSHHELCYVVLCRVAHGCKLLVLVFYRPYDTMEEVIGIRGTPGHGSLKEWNVAYRELPLAPGGRIDWAELRTAIRPGEDSQCRHQTRHKMFVLSSSSVCRTLVVSLSGLFSL